ncbi:Argonaute siRNA chaperone complex subunit Arb1 domain-containing protein [Trichoderma ceciliae]
MKAQTLALVALGLLSGEVLGQTSSGIAVPPLISSVSAAISSARASGSDIASSIASEASSVASSIRSAASSAASAATGSSTTGTETSATSTSTSTGPVSTTITSVESGTTVSPTTIAGTTDSQTTQAPTTIPGTTRAASTRTVTTTSSTGLAFAPTVDAKLLAPIIGAAAAANITFGIAMPLEMTSTMVSDCDVPETAQQQPEIDESLVQINASSTIDTAEEAAEEAEEVEDDVSRESTQPLLAKKKRKNKSLASRGPTALPKNRGNGFEEYFADPPMTPEEAMQEKQEIYSPDLPFENRMQSCIQRFRSRRRIQYHRILYFDEYLFLGGVDTSQGAYTGRDPKELKQLTPTQRREATARDVIHEGSGGGGRFYDGDETKWTVDFTGVAAGFLSTTIVPLTGLQTRPMEAAIDVVENFLRYVLHHDVCPEYEEDVKGAMRVCLAARNEWPMLNSLQTALPGLFNLAATELFSKPDPDAWAFHLFKVPEGFDAKSVFYSVIAMLEDPKPFECLVGGSIELLRQYECTLEITKIHLPTEDMIERFKRLAIDICDKKKKLRLMPIGKLSLKPATIEDGWVHPDTPHPLQGREIDLYFEQGILANLRPGMKMTLEIGELGAGVRFVRRIRKIVPSFYTFLPQELMRGFKPPRENDRPAPSIHDPTAEDNQAVDE